MHRIWTLASVLTARRLYTRKRTDQMAIYLTFDDGPDPEHTMPLLGLLEAHGAKGTFFLQGQRVEQHGEIVPEIVRGGHTLGNHSYSHARFTDLGRDGQLAEISRTDRLLSAYDGNEKHVFRPPYGKLRLNTLLMCMYRRQDIAMWTHDSLDFRLQYSQLVDRMTGLNIRSGDIILFHDDGHAAVAALQRLLPAWRNAGFRFAAL